MGKPTGCNPWACSLALTPDRASLLLGSRRHVRAERRGRQAGTVDEVYLRVTRPAVTHGHRPPYLRARYDHVVALDVGLGRHVLTLRASNREALQGAARRLQP